MSLSMYMEQCMPMGAVEVRPQDILSVRLIHNLLSDSVMEAQEIPGNGTEQKIVLGENMEGNGELGRGDIWHM